MRRALDDSTLLDFGGEFLVVCPRCAAQAWVRDRGPAAEPRVAFTCSHCGLSQFWQPAAPGQLTAAGPGRYPEGVVAMGGAVDWYFHLPLWLQTPCCGETLWAHNAAHLDFIENFVGAALREHRRGEHGWSNQSLANRLPKWMQAAHNRPEVIKGLARLKARL
jgi:hypothetical protein